MFNYFRDILGTAKDFAIRMGLPIASNAGGSSDSSSDSSTSSSGSGSGGDEFGYDFTLDDYQTVMQKVSAIKAQLASEGYNYAEKHPRLVYAVGVANTEDALSKIAALFGVTDFISGFFAALEEFMGVLWESFVAAVKERNWGVATKILKQIMQKLMSRGFFNKLVEKIGEEAAEKFVKQTAARALPVIGWVIIIGSIVWALSTCWPKHSPGDPIV